jgi:hypothetical protein
MNSYLNKNSYRKTSAKKLRISCEFFPVTKGIYYTLGLTTKYTILVYLQYVLVLAATSITKNPYQKRKESRSRYERCEGVAVWPPPTSQTGQGTTGSPTCTTSQLQTNKSG